MFQSLCPCKFADLRPWRYKKKPLTWLWLLTFYRSCMPDMVSSMYMHFNLLTFFYQDLLILNPQHPLPCPFTVCKTTPEYCCTAAAFPDTRLATLSFTTIFICRAQDFVNSISYLPFLCLCCIMNPHFKPKHILHLDPAYTQTQISITCFPIFYSLFLHLVTQPNHQSFLLESVHLLSIQEKEKDAHVELPPQFIYGHTLTFKIQPTVAQKCHVRGNCSLIGPKYNHITSSGGFLHSLSLSLFPLCFRATAAKSC